MGWGCGRPRDGRGTCTSGRNARCGDVADIWNRLHGWLVPFQQTLFNR